MKSPIKPSYLIALTLAVTAGAWIYSGQLENDPFAAEPDAAETEETVAQAEPTVAERAPPAVRVMDSVAAPHRAILLYTGRTEAERRAVLSAETDGRVVEIAVEESDRIAEGALIARIAASDRYARLNEAKALVKQREIEHEAAKSLAGKGFQTESARAEAEANLEAAKARLESIRVDLNRITIEAPFDGVVESRTIEIGDYVRPGDEIARIADLDPIVVTAQVSEREIGRVELGALAEISLMDGVARTGIVSRVSTTADSATRTFEVEVELENQDGGLLDGMTAKVSLPAQEVMAHRITPALLALDEEGRVGVKSVDADNRVVFHPITIVEDRADGMFVAGLPREVTLIVVGQAFVRPGVEVRPVPVQMNGETPDPGSFEPALSVGEAAGDRS
jgi:multidrug efflux system membrane fusion protein